MIFKVAYLVSYISQGITLEPATSSPRELRGRRHLSQAAVLLQAW
jgi:hypothetical protein